MSLLRIAEELRAIARELHGAWYDPKEGIIQEVAAGRWTVGYSRNNIQPGRFVVYAYLDKPGTMARANALPAYYRSSPGYLTEAQAKRGLRFVSSWLKKNRGEIDEVRALLDPSYTGRKPEWM